jgi:hypothetical protein
MNDNLQWTVPEQAERKAYSTPEIMHELKLETRAGSPLRPELTDPLGVDPTKPQVN